MPFKSHDEYFAARPQKLRDRLARIQREVERRVPGCVRTISYSLPAFKKEKIFFYFAAFTNHIGIQPDPSDRTDSNASAAHAPSARTVVRALHDDGKPIGGARTKEA